MKGLITLLASLIVISQARAATQTVFTDTPINYSKYTRTVYFSGKFRLYTAGKKGVNLRIKNSNLTSRPGFDLIVPLDGLEFVNMISRNPVSYDDSIMIQAQCYGAHSVTYILGTDYALYGSICQINSLTVSRANPAPAPAPALAPALAPAPTPSPASSPDWGRFRGRALR